MDPKERSLLEKLLRLALCPSAAPGEWNVAAQKLVALMRNSGTTAEELLSFSSGGVRSRGQTSPPSPGAHGVHVTMTFGKYKWQSVEWIAKNDPSYLFWVLGNVQWLSPPLREEIKRRLHEQRRPT